MSGRIDSGIAHTCAILGNGSLRCWGHNAQGPLGYGNTDAVGDDEEPSSAGPVDLGPGRTAVAVANGAFHTCAILDNRSMRCWGHNPNGQLGYGNTSNIGDDEAPGSVGTVDLGPGRTASEVAAGEGYTCALMDNGQVRCWGFGNFGALGYGNKDNVGDDELPSSAGPVNLGAGRTALGLASGNGHTCAILDNGTVVCWGFGPFGALGYGNLNHVGDDETPASVGPVNLGVSNAATGVAAGSGFTCVILDDGDVKCWGRGDDGRLGYGNTNDVLSPSSVGTVDLGAGRTASAIATGVNHACVILDNGSVRCWGDAIYGQLGYGNQTDIGDDETPGSYGPVDLGPGRTAVAISAGQYFTCALLDNGDVRCWGESDSGRIGYPGSERIGDNEAPGTAGPVDLGNPSGVLETVAGGTHTCSRFNDGQLRCWGNGGDGRLGYGNTENIGDDENLGSVGSVDLGASGPKQIVVGDTHTCALLADGTVRCWGLGSEGRLGYANESSVGDDETPSAVSTVSLGESAIAIAAGAQHTCALLASGAMRCWGLNGSGQLGYVNTATIGDDEAPSTAGPVSLGGVAAEISAGGSHTCARLSNGTLRCWGLGASGRLGYANTNTIGDNEAPSTVGSIGIGGSAASVLAGGDHSCALLVDRSLRCWGANASGQLGYANTTPIGDNETPAAAGPVSLGGGLNADLIATGEMHSCAVLGNGGVRCWGSGADGRLGYASTAAVGDNESPGEVGPVNMGAGLNAMGVAAGGAHTCSTLTVGLVRCWGSNEFGQLGNGNTENVGDDETPAEGDPVDFVDDLPVAIDDASAIDEDAEATEIDVLANDENADGGPIEIVSNTLGSHGAVTPAGEGASLSYAPDPDYCGADSFTYELNGGSSATVSVTIACVDDPPLAVNDSATVAEDSSANAIDVLANDTDSDGGSREVASKADGVHGTVAITGGGAGLTYTPDPDYCGADSFTYELNGGSSATVSLAVTCVDDAPSAVDDSATVAEDSGANSIDVLANDADIDGGTKAISSASGAAHGAVVPTGGSPGAHTAVDYQADPDYCGADSFTYELNGGSSATVSVTIACVDDPPLAVNDSATIAEDAAVTAIDVLSNDTDGDGGPKAIASVVQPANGTAAIAAGGLTVTYLPDPNYCGADSFTYELNGGSVATVSVTVICVDDDDADKPPASPPSPPTAAPLIGAAPSTPSRGPTTVVNVTPGVGILSGRRRPRVAVKGTYAFFTLTCRFTHRDCGGRVIVKATVPSVSLGATKRRVLLVKGRFRIGARRSVLVRSKLRRRARRIFDRKRSLRGVGGRMAIVDRRTRERGSIEVTLVRRPRASLLPSGKKTRKQNGRKRSEQGVAGPRARSRQGAG